VLVISESTTDLVFLRNTHTSRHGSLTIVILSIIQCHYSPLGILLP
jgi:hypothetical protein